MGQRPPAFEVEPRSLERRALAGFIFAEVVDKAHVEVSETVVQLERLLPVVSVIRPVGSEDEEKPSDTDPPADR